MSVPPEPAPTPPAGPSAGDSGFWTVITALIFLYLGFGLGLEGISDSRAYNLSVTAFVWIARVVGIGLIAVVVLSRVWPRASAWLYVALSAVATVGCVAVGVVWIAHSDAQGLLIAILGLLCAGPLMALFRRLSGEAPS